VPKRRHLFQRPRLAALGDVDRPAADGDERDERRRHGEGRGIEDDRQPRLREQQHAGADGRPGDHADVVDRVA
jgi:hypothetical protein